MNSYMGQNEETKGRPMPVAGTVNVLKKRDDLESIDREVPYSLLCKKAEKLSAAVYLVSGFLSDNEPMKWQMRECGLRILSDISSLGNGVVSDGMRQSKNLKVEIEKLVSLIEVSVMAGFVSDMNATILKEEYRSLWGTMSRNKIGDPQGRYIFAREFFSGTGAVRSKEEENISQGDSPKGHDKDIGRASERGAADVPELVRAAVDGIARKEKSEEENIRPTDGNGAEKSSANPSRREIILQLIRGRGDRGEVSIKDIVSHVPGCGEKTVQRELGALVAEGILQKTGDRRWSRYSLTSAQ